MAARLQEYPVSLLSPAEHETLLDGKHVTFTAVDDGESNAPEWSRVVLDGTVRLIAKKEVCRLRFSIYLSYGCTHIQRIILF